LRSAVFLRGRNDTRAGRGQQLEDGQFKKIQIMVQVEMTLLAPLFAIRPSSPRGSR
jgi:hypothetical protein